MPVVAVPVLKSEALTQLPQRFDAYSSLPQQFSFIASDLEEVNFPSGLGFELFSDVLESLKKRSLEILARCNLGMADNEIKMSVFYDDPVLVELKIAESVEALIDRGVEADKIVQFTRQQQKLAVFENAAVAAQDEMERLKQQFDGAIFGIHGSDYNTTAFKIVINIAAKVKDDNASSASLELIAYPGQRGDFDQLAGRGSLYLLYRIASENVSLQREGIERVSWGTEEDSDYVI